MSRDFYKELNKELITLLDRAWFTNLANASALLMQKITAINWTGFYLAYENRLFLGPFQGKPACLRIDFGKGVCGTAAQTQKTLVIGDVHEFPGHIACDSASASEIVIPLILNGRTLGVLDVDSPKLNRFTEQDKIGLELLAETLVASTHWPESFLATN
jgi:L-methionine (R)-S-oxide reductase